MENRLRPPVVGEKHQPRRIGTPTTTFGANFNPNPDRGDIIIEKLIKEINVTPVGAVL